MAKSNGALRSKESDGALRSRDCGNNNAPHSTWRASLRRVKGSAVLMLMFAVLIAGISQAQAAPPPPNRILTCTFNLGQLRTALGNSLPSSLGTFQASYIIIYVRQNPNEGQQIGTTG